MSDQVPKHPRIKLLPDALINRIAAGEVVERPAAVLKELLENSLDAGADRIEIETSGGGKKLIRVRDNGRGMDQDDLYMCLERHATSKLAPDSDLLSIATLGFRGEALPSIGSVSRLSITSMTENGQGHVVEMNNGKLKDLRPAPANRGTTVEVAHLFQNIPARRKFLKSDHTEKAHLMEAVRSYALSRDSLRIVYKEDGREVLSVESRHDFQTRVYRVLGRNAAESLVPLEYQDDSLTISGWVSGPEHSIRSTSNLFMYVLGRPVKDRLLNRALADGFNRLLPPGQWPTAVIFINLDPQEVDVNVHPAKAEVRFRQPNAVFSALSAAVRQAVGKAPVSGGDLHDPFAAQLFPAPSKRAPVHIPPRPTEQSFDFKSSDEAKAIPPWLSGGADNSDERSAGSELYKPVETTAEAQQPHDDEKQTAPDNQQTQVFKSSFRSEAAVAATAPESPNPRPDKPERQIEDLRPLAQLYDSYILAQGSRGLYIVDQHAAHERITFNHLKETMAKNGLPGQAIMFPEPMDLSPQQALAAEKLVLHLARLGFDLQHFGDRTFILKGAPAILGTQDPWPPLLEILSAAQGRLKSFEEAGLTEALETMANSWLYSISCRAALKAGEKMTLEAMDRLLRDMAATPNGAYCPHGRPAIQLIDRNTIEKRFDRR